MGATRGEDGLGMLVEQAAEAFSSGAALDLRRPCFGRVEVL